MLSRRWSLSSERPPRTPVSRSNCALLPRSRVYVLHGLTAEYLQLVFRHALHDSEQGLEASTIHLTTRCYSR